MNNSLDHYKENLYAFIDAEIRLADAETFRDDTIIKIKSAEVTDDRKETLAMELYDVCIEISVTECNARSLFCKLINISDEVDVSVWNWTFCPYKDADDMLTKTFCNTVLRYIRGSYENLHKAMVIHCKLMSVTPVTFSCAKGT
jgi:hypothetical protein